MSDNNQIEVVSSNYFAQIPEWVMYANISKSSVMVYLVLDRFSNSRTRQCFPSRETLEEKAGVSKNTLDKCLKELIGIGAIKVEKRRSAGKWPSNLYTLVKENPHQANPEIGLDHGLLSGFDHGLEIGNHHDPETSPLTKEITNQRKRTKESPLTRSEQSMFDQFWAVYPIDTDDYAAMVAFKWALKHATFEEIMEGAEWFAAFREGEDHRFTKVAKNWLRERSWSSRPVKSKQRGTRRDEFDVLFEEATQHVYGRKELGA